MRCADPNALRWLCKPVKPMHEGRTGLQDRAYPQAARLHALMQAALSVDTATLSDAAMQQGLKGVQVGQQIDAARVQALKAAMAV
jgi:tRNA nucleotidyltransferase (CCA-adding enzyme)